VVYTLARNARTRNSHFWLDQFFESRDLVRVKAFSGSTDLRETMEKTGVIDKPNIYLLNDQAAFSKTSGY